METIVARVQYGFECIQYAIKGVKNGGSGVKAKLDPNDEKQADTIAMLDDTLKEFEDTNKFIAEGPKNGGGMMGGMMTGMNDMGASGSSLKVDANSMKDHLLAKKIKFNELIGVESY